jgi:hypothetical protein
VRFCSRSARGFTWLAFGLGALDLLAACTPNQVIRSSVDVCVSATEPLADSSCERNSIEQTKAYTLGFVEFDDQGRLYDPRQLDVLFSQLTQIAAYQDLCVVTFVHGWKHNAGFDDPNVQSFRNLLTEIAKIEGARNRPERQRRVVGIYAGWRGLSAAGDDPFSEYVRSNLTLWARKDAAQRVADGEIRELFARTKKLQDEINRRQWPNHIARDTRLLTIGHSFGGLVVFSALAPYLVEAATPSPMSDQAERIGGVGNLVILINPAFEATRYEPIRRLVAAPRQYVPWQAPALVTVTSSSDSATGVAFPLGRSMNTALERFRDDEKADALNTPGHLQKFQTHTLSAPPGAKDQPMSAFIGDPRAETEAFDSFNQRWRPDGLLQPNWERIYADGAVLKHTAYDPNNPFWVVTADPTVIDGHNDIQSGVFVAFVRQLYDDLFRLQAKSNPWDAQ